MNTLFFGSKKSRILLPIAFIMVLFFWKTDMALKIISDIFTMLAPFLLAGAMAFVINVPMRFIEKNFFYRKKQKKVLSWMRPVSLILAIIFCALIIAFAILVVVPQVQDTVVTLTEKLEIFLPQARDFIIQLFNNNPEIENFLDSIDITEIRTSVIDFLRTGIVNVFGSTLSVASSVVSLIARLFVSVVFALYILLQKETLSRQFKKIMFAFLEKAKATKLVKVFSMTENAFSRFITGQCLEALILGVLIVVVLMLFQIPFAVLIGVVVGFSSIIPIMGAFFGAGIGSFLLLIENPMHALYFLIIFIVIQQIEGNLIYPKVVGESIGLPAIWVLASVSIGGSLMGVAGILLCIPLASVAYTLLKEEVHERLERREAEKKIE